MEKMIHLQFHLLIFKQKIYHTNSIKLRYSVWANENNAHLITFKKLKITTFNMYYTNWYKVLIISSFTTKLLMCSLNFNNKSYKLIEEFQKYNQKFIFLSFIPFKISIEAPTLRELKSEMSNLCQKSRSTTKLACFCVFYFILFLFHCPVFIEWSIRHSWINIICLPKLIKIEIYFQK